MPEPRCDYLPLGSTFFAPAEFAPMERILEQANCLRATPMIDQILEAIPGLGAILNQERQVVAVNKRCLSTLGVSDASKLLGKRFGEIVLCTHEPEGPSGCGTSQACKHCGMVAGILACQEESLPNTREALVAVNQGQETLEYEAVFSPLTVEDSHYVVCALRDISSEHRRRSLERVFFHDLLNTAGGLSGISHMLVEALFR